MLETLDYTIRIGSTPTFLYFRFVSLLCLRSTLRLLMVYIRQKSPQILDLGPYHGQEWVTKKNSGLSAVRIVARWTWERLLNSDSRLTGSEKSSNFLSLIISSRLKRSPYQFSLLYSYHARPLSNKIGGFFWDVRLVILQKICLIPFFFKKKNKKKKDKIR